MFLLINSSSGVPKLTCEIVLCNRRSWADFLFKKMGKSANSIKSEEKFSQFFLQQWTVETGNQGCRTDVSCHQQSNASERIRTSMGYCPPGPKPGASANSATLATPVPANRSTQLQVSVLISLFYVGTVSRVFCLLF